MIEVLVPATSANCAVGFDCLGMALAWQAKFVFDEAETLTISGCPEEYQTSDNLVVQAFDHVCKAYDKPLPPFSLVIDSPVPFARGMGSSSCCVVAGIAAANAWYQLHLDDERLLELATELEGHPDNVAPALFGGMTACFMEHDPDLVRFVKFAPADFYCLAVIPPYEVSTPEARKVLPQTLPFSDAVSQVGHALVFEKAIIDGDQSLLASCCKDVLHEPYRRRLIPDYDLVKTMADQRSLPFWISGSGPTLLSLSLNQEDLRNMAAELAGKAPELTCRILKIDQEGTVVNILP